MHKYTLVKVSLLVVVSMVVVFTPILSSRPAWAWEPPDHAGIANLIMPVDSYGRILNYSKYFNEAIEASKQAVVDKWSDWLAKQETVIEGHSAHIGRKWTGTKDTYQKIYPLLTDGTERLRFEVWCKKTGLKSANIISARWANPDDPTNINLNIKYYINGFSGLILYWKIYTESGLPPSYITVICPNGGEVWEIGSTQLIELYASGILYPIEIQLSRDGGLNWQKIIDKADPYSKVEWTVTGPAIEQAMIRILTPDTSYVWDRSDEVFTILTNTQEDTQDNSFFPQY